MTPPFRFLKPAIFGCLAAALLVGTTSTSRAQSVPLYSDTPIPSTSTAQNATHYMQLVNLSVPGPGTFTLTGFTIGVYFNAGTPANTPNSSQTIALYFYNGADTSSTSADALATATSAAVDSSTGLPTGVSASFAAPATAGNMTASFTFARPVTLTLTGTSVAVEVYLLNNAGDNFSTLIQGRFESAPPTMGTAASYVWNDLNDNVFQGSEQTNFGQATGAYTRLGLSGVPVVPEPGTWAILAGGIGLVAVVARRRLA